MQDAALKKMPKTQMRLTDKLMAPPDELSGTPEYEASEKATYARTVAIAVAERNWRVGLAVAERDFAATQANIETNVTTGLAGVERTFAS
jgi:hypothetical protein